MIRSTFCSSLVMLLMPRAYAAAPAAGELVGTYVDIHYSEDGICYDAEDKAGVLVTYSSTASPYEWTYASSTILPFLGSSFQYTKGTSTKAYEGYYDTDGYTIGWDTTASSYDDGATSNTATHTWEMGDLQVVKTETWDEDAMAIFVKFEVTNTHATSKLKSFTYAHVINPVDSAATTRSSNTRNDLLDVDADGTNDWAQAQGRTSSNNRTMGFGLCDPRVESIGFNAGTDVSVASISYESDPDAAVADYQLVYEHTESVINPGDTQMFGFILAFGSNASNAQDAYQGEIARCYDLDGDGYENDLGDDTDCDDEDADVNPGVAEIWYDGYDQDCGGEDDYDQDGDGYVEDENEGLPTYDPGTGDEISGTGEAAGGDCDDTDENVNPGAEEVWYDGYDQNCDGESDYDQDGDGYVPEEYEGMVTRDPATDEVVDDGTGTGSGDCDDEDANVNPAVEETWYDGIDQNCDGLSDFDADGDGYVPDEYEGRETIDPDTGEVVDDGTSTEGGDCDDNDPLSNPGVGETWYNGVDEDCGGDDDYDQDGDGYVEDGNGGLVTTDPDGNVIDGTGELPEGDCDDTDPLTNPDSEEIWYDGIDEDCGGDDDYDQDGDGYVPDEYEGLPTSDTQGNEIPGTGELDSGDCDDEDADIHPGAEDEWYDGIDSDCAGNDDFDQDEDGVPATVDEDGDPLDTNGDGTIDDRDGGDCDDEDEDVNPSAEDEWYDGIDEDCGENDDYDQDEDGYVDDEYVGLETTDTHGDPIDGTGEANGGDCDDTDGTVHPDADETWYDGIDEDCDGEDDYDADGDGHVPEEYDGLPTYTGEGQDEEIPGTGELPADDCDDTDPAITTCAAEVPFYKGGGGCSCSIEGNPGSARTAGFVGLFAVLGALWRRRRE